MIPGALRKGSASQKSFACFIWRLLPWAAGERELSTGNPHGGTSGEVHGVPPECQRDFGAARDHTHGAGSGQATGRSRQIVTVGDLRLRVVIPSALDAAGQAPAFLQRPIDGAHQKLLLERVTARKVQER